MNIQKYEEQLFDLQMTLTVIFIITVLVSLSLTYNEKLVLKKECPIYSPETFNKIAITNRVVVLCLTLLYLYINYENKQVAVYKNEDTTPFNLQLASGGLTTLAAIITLYVVITYSDYNLVPISENPEI
ncbi:MAG: hypothetical protein ACK5HP_01435 [Bacilli bacterium]